MTYGKIQRIEETTVKNLAILLMIVSLLSCAGVGDPQEPGEPINPVTPAAAKKSPQGYVVGGDPARFGGFIGNCSDDENFANYWQCQSENAGNGFH